MFSSYVNWPEGIHCYWFKSPLKSWYPHWLVGSYYPIVPSFYPHHILIIFISSVISSLHPNNQRCSLPVMILFEYPRSVRISLILQQHLRPPEIARNGDLIFVVPVPSRKKKNMNFWRLRKIFRMDIDFNGFRNLFSDVHQLIFGKVSNHPHRNLETSNCHVPPCAVVNLNRTSGSQSSPTMLKTSPCHHY